MTQAVEPFGLGASRTSTQPGFSAKTGRIDGEPCQVPPTKPEAGPPGSEKSGMEPIAVAKMVVTAGAAGTLAAGIAVVGIVVVGTESEPEVIGTPLDEGGVVVVVVEPSAEIARCSTRCWA
jgi:hypothetical protein